MKDIFGQEINIGDVVAVAIRGSRPRGMAIRVVKKFKNKLALLYDPRGKSGAWHMTSNIVKAPPHVTLSEEFTGNVPS